MRLSPGFLLLLSCFFYVLLVVFSCANASDTISSSEPLRDSETLLSGGERFKLGFFSPGNSRNRYVGIMFNLPSPTPAVVWVANRDKPLHDSGGTLIISQDGNLVILNGNNDIVWSSNISNSVRNSSARLMDTGNLVLKDSSNGRIVWESFRDPTDSLLEFMKMGIDKSTNTTTLLKSWRSPDDPSVGSFSSGIQPQNILQSFVWRNSSPYWRSGPWNKQIYINIPEMKTYYLSGLDLVADDAGTAYQTFSNPDQSWIVYYSLNSTGSYQEKVWDASKKDWMVTWETPRSECDFYAKCGQFGTCNPKSSPICRCMQGFRPKNEGEWDKGDWSGGCIRRTALDCDRNNSDVDKGKKDGFLKLQAVGVPDFAIWVPSTQPTCESDCLTNCSCTAYSYDTGIGCMHWNTSLIDIQEFSMDGAADLFIRVAYSELAANNKKGIRVVAIAVSVLISSIIVFISGYLLWKLLAKRIGRKRNYREGMSKDAVEKVSIEDMTLYNFDMLAHATENFHSASKLGEGGFGSVYKGKLPDGQEIAVKRLSQSSNQGLEEFMNEVALISRLQHRNLVRLLGCCIDRGEKMLVYEFMPNRSLDAYLFGPHQEKFLDWRARAIIIEGTGRGLLYLHRDSRLRIIHRDLKTSNILLDEYLTPKISDFGMARIFGGNQDQAKTNRVVGTYGYMAPEYAMHGRFSEKSDVYSFGVLILEILSGRRNSSFYDEDELTLLGYAWKLWNEKNIAKLIDPKMFDPRLEKEVVRCVQIGLLCVQEHAEDRPNVSMVLSMLTNEIAELHTPKQPAFTSGHGSSFEQGSRKSQGSVDIDTITIVEPR